MENDRANFDDGYTEPEDESFLHEVNSSSHENITHDKNEEPNPINENHVTTLNVSKDELTFIKKKRKRIKLANPKEQFIFRKEPIGILSHLLHIFIVTAVFLFFIYFIFLFPTTETISGVGDFNTTTQIETLTNLILIAVIIYYLFKLKQKVEAFPVKRYWFAMASNSLLKLVTLLFKYMIVFLSMVGFTLWFIFTLKVIDESDLILMFDNFGNSRGYEILLIVDFFVSLIIVFYSFRFCKKELQ